MPVSSKRTKNPTGRDAEAWMHGGIGLVTLCDGSPKASRRLSVMLDCYNRSSAIQGMVFFQLEGI